MLLTYCTLYSEEKIKTIILAGGLGTRISEETANKPKPMVLIGDKPILWHIMKIYAIQGFDDFIIAGGYKVDVIEKWVSSLDESWSISVLDTGLQTQTGGRIKRCMERFPEDRYFLTYGDGVGNIDLSKLLDLHVQHKRLETVTAVRPPARFGVLQIDSGLVNHFGEKNQTDAGWINGGFFVLEGAVTNFIESDEDLFETKALPSLASLKQLSAYQHEGFWQPMDTLREMNLLKEQSNYPDIPWFSIKS